MVVACLVTVDQGEQLLNRSGGCPLLARDSIHCEGFPSTSLTISENGDVVAVQGGLDEVPAILKDLLLCPRHENGIEGEGVDIPVDLHLQSHSIHLLRDFFVFEILLSLAEWPHTCEDPNRTLQILCRVVKSPPSHIRLTKLVLGYLCLLCLQDCILQLSFRLLDSFEVCQIDSLDLVENLSNLFHEAKLLQQRLQERLDAPQLWLV
mmetsp:Transcript_61827/g.130536  ORF Transcript_61827/g.130536 Transcript_61827/m.130536 type:complete len:207 (+) Transcript_61827:720-1340(+)